MKVLSLFDGMSCGRAALESAGIKVDKYFASEIDKYAMAVSAYNYHDIIQIGDVCKVDVKTLPKIDLILAGSPCQGFSLAGKQLNFNDPRSALFFEFVRILKEVREINPDVKFLLENVKMKKEYQDKISDIMGCNPIIINSALVSAQNRVRLYWTNIEVIGLPKDRGILLKDILEDDVEERYYLKDKMINWLDKHSKKKQSEGCGFKYEPEKIDSKANALNKRMAKMGVDDNYIKVLGNLYKNNPQGGRIYSPSGKGACLNGEAGGLGAKTGLYAVALRNKGEGKKPEVKSGDKANCLTSVQSDSMIITHNLQHRNGKGKGGKGHLSKTDQKSHCVDTGNAQAIERDYKIRRLTPVECERLQTVPDNYTRFGLDIRCHIWDNKGSECNHIWRKEWSQYAKLKDAISLSQAKRLDSAINTNLDLLEVELQNLGESLLIRRKSALSKDAPENSRQLKVIVSNIINNGKGSKLQNIRNVQFVIEKSVTMGGEECVSFTLLQRQDMETLCVLKKIELENISPMATKTENTIKQKTVDFSIESLLRIFSEEISETERLFIILILINLTIIRSIFMSAKTTKFMRCYINSSNLWQENLLETELLALRMENITGISNSASYKMLGNGWTRDVIAFILQFMNEEKLKQAKANQKQTTIFDMIGEQ